MATTQFPLSTIINVSVSAAQPGVGQYNTSNLAIFSSEAYASSFGTLGYQIYTSPTQVGVDFGTSSQTYASATAVFSQQPNILAGGGYLVVIPFIPETHTMTLSGIPASGSFTLTYAAGTTAAINWNDSVATIQTKIQALTGYGSVVVTGSLASESLVVQFFGVYGAVAVPTVGGTGLLTAGSTAITITPVATVVGETIAAAITRSSSLVQYFGLMGIQIFTQTDMLAAAAVVQALNKIAFFVSLTSADIQVGGMLDLLRSGGYTQSRGLYYGSNSGAAAAIDFMAAYAGLALSVNFNGSNTTLTMNLKTLATIQPDPTLTSAQLTLAQAAGVDVYLSLQGISKVLTSNANGGFFDEVYNLQWLVGALQVAGFNYLATVANKVPQTENGMRGLRNAYRQVMEQAVTNQYVGPGTWNSATTFGNQTNFLNNIAQRGYYIYSPPIAQQLQTARVARQSPLVQIALKEAGAIQSSSIVVYVNQ